MTTVTFTELYVLCIEHHSRLGLLITNYVSIRKFPSLRFNIEIDCLQWAVSLNNLKLHTKVFLACKRSHINLWGHKDICFRTFHVVCCRYDVSDVRFLIMFFFTVFSALYLNLQYNGFF